MKKIYILIFVITFSLVNISYSQQFSSGHEYCAWKKQHTQNPVLNTKDSPNTPNHKFNVLSYKLNLDIRSCFLSPFPHSYNGEEIIMFSVDTALSSVAFNAVNSSLQVDSVRLAGLFFVHSGDWVKIKLDTTYYPGDIVSVKIYYHHCLFF